VTTIRRATPEDAEAIAAVIVSSWRTTYRSLIADAAIDGRTVEKQAPKWRERLARDGCVAHVAEVEIDGAPGVVGFAEGGPNRWTEPPFDAFDGELNALYLLQTHQRGGLGRHLVRAHAVGLLELGHRSMIVWVLDRNPARAFYERVGGRFVGTAEIVIEGSPYPDVAYAWDDLHALIDRLDSAGTPRV
jgi:GNAT superfamily N-acetyltransferase